MRNSLLGSLGEVLQVRVFVCRHWEYLGTCMLSRIHHCVWGVAVGSCWVHACCLGSTIVGGGGVAVGSCVQC